MLKDNLCEIFRVTTELRNRPECEWKTVLKSCSEDFLWDMCYACGCSPNDSKAIMAERILKCKDTLEEKILQLTELLKEVRIAFNCWTDNGKLNVNEAYGRCYERLETWLIFFKSEERKSCQYRR